LLLVETILDNGCSCKQALLQATQGLVLDLDGSFLFKGLLLVEAALFEDWQQNVLVFLLGSVILVIFLAHLHLVASFSIDRLLKDANEKVFGLLIIGGAQLVDCLLAFVADGDLGLHLLLL